MSKVDAIDSSLSDESVDKDETAPTVTVTAVPKAAEQSEDENYIGDVCALLITH